MGQATRTDFPSYTLVEALDAAHAHGVARGVNLSESRALLLNAFSPPRLRSLEAAHARQYRLADPFPHTVFDGLLPEAVLSAVAEEQPEAYNNRGCAKGTKFCITEKISGGTLVQSERVRVGKYVAIARRSERNRESVMGPHTIMVFRALKSNEFRAFLERLSGISPLISDPKYAGAGVHFAAPGAKLNLHADFNMGYGLQRRVNTFLYLNRGWREEYGGHLQLWDRNLSRCVQRILPTWNRFVAFSTGDFTYHGHPTPLSCPDRRMRRALVLYFYAQNRPPNECSCRHRAEMVCPRDCGVPHNTLWVTPRHCAACEDPSCARYPSEHVARDGAYASGGKPAAGHPPISLRQGPIFPRTGQALPSVGFGTCCRKSAIGAPLVASAKIYLAEGGRHIDTAQLYHNHKDLKVAIAEGGVPREQLWVTSKINTRPDKDAVRSRAAASSSIDQSLSELGISYLDVMLIHGAWKQTLAERLDVWNALVDARKAGKVRHIGVSNYKQSQIEELQTASGVAPEVVELEFHPWVPNSTYELVQWCQRRGMVIIAYGSLGSKALNKDQMQGSVATLATKYKASSAQVLLRWALERGVAVIPGATSRAHIRDNLLLKDFRLSAEDMQLLEMGGRPARFRRWFNLGRTPRTSD